MDDVNEMAKYLGLPPQQKGEDEREFRLRVATVLRNQGRLIESQEIIMGRRYDDPRNPPIGELGNPLTGVAGAIAAQLQGVDYGRRAAEDDQVAGALALAKPDPSKAALLKAFDMLGPAAFDLLG